MRAAKGTGMTDEQVKAFVDGCQSDPRSFVMLRCKTDVTDIGVDYPSYELYTEALSNGIFGGPTGQQLRLTVGKDRKIQDVRVY